MKKVKAKVLNEKGLHMLPSAQVVRCAQQFKSQITLCHNCQEANACSLLQILTLGASFGADIEIVASGPDENEAIDSMLEVFNDGGGI